MSARLVLDGVACRRGGRLLFEGLDLEMRAGETVIVTGPNGVGKSSLLRMIAGLLPPFAGHIERSGILSLAEEKAALDEGLPLARALLFWARLDGGEEGDVADALDRLGLGPLADVPVRLLSTGQRKRAALARTLASRAAIWLLDEPGNGLDIASVDLLRAAVAAHNAGGGITLATSHQPLGLAAREIAL